MGAGDLPPGRESCGGLGACADPQRLAPPKRSPEQPELGWDTFHQAFAGERDTDLIPVPFNIQVSQTQHHLLTRWDRAPRKGPKGERFVHVTTSQADRAHTRTHTPSSATERSVKTSFTHTLSVCARLTRYSTAGDGAGKGGGDG